MLEKLVIFLPSDTLARPSWVVVNQAGEILQTVHEGDPALLPALTEARSIVTIVPAEDILLTSTKMPKMSRSRLLQALPYALEEQTIDDIETLHVAALDEAADGTISAAVVQQEKMAGWLALLQSWQVKPDSFLPLTLCIPMQQEAWRGLVSDIAVIRTGQYQGFAADAGNISTLALPANTELVKASAQNIVDICAKEAALWSGPNLLQGKYAVKKSRLPQMNNVWRIATYSAVAWVIALFLYPTFSYFILKMQLSQIDGDIKQIYKRQFPQATSVIAPKSRMQDKLQKMSGQLGEHHPLVWLGNVGKALRVAPGVKLKQVDYQHNQLVLTLMAQSSEELDTFSDYLTQQGLTVKQQNANLVGARVNATLLIES